ncbi:MAG: hypothetical protein ACFCU2_03340 [Acidimicrobiia bacterium]
MSTQSVAVGSPHLLPEVAGRTAQDVSSTHPRTDPAVPLRGDECALLGNEGGAPGDDEDETSPSVLSELPA